VILVTMGCSWTVGIGVGYDKILHSKKDRIPKQITEDAYNNIAGDDYPDYTKFLKNRTNKKFFKENVWKELSEKFTTDDFGTQEFKKIAWDKKICDSFSFRGLLSKEYKIKNLNYSKGGSSNDEQFFHMENIFGNPKTRKDFIKQKPIVLWGITSTGRIYRDKSYMLKPEEDEQVRDYITSYLKLGFYDHKKSIESICNKIELWNIIFKHYNIPVIWFDTFNTHKYPSKLENFLTGGDLLTQILKSNKLKFRSNSYHFSLWSNDDDRIQVGVDNELLNPISFHPTKKGHQTIRDILSPYIKNIIHGAYV
jgi:hypothetical protein